MKLFEIITESLFKAAAYNKHSQIAPAAILWTDKERQWETSIPLLRKAFPQLLTLGTFTQETKSGPAIWLKCMVARALPEADWHEDHVPILYLPGISRMELRALESCPTELQPLAELQYRGVFWSQKNGKDWTLNAFLKSADGGAGLDVAQDEKTLQAMRRAFMALLDEPIDAWTGKRLEATDFDKLLAPDPVKNLLRWLDEPVTTKSQWCSEEWEAYTALCKTEFSFNPSNDGELIGAEKLAHRQGAWAQVWQRFVESPQLYPKLPDLLRKTSLPDDLFSDKSAWPQFNDTQEDELRSALNRLAECAPHQARTKLMELEKLHGGRRSWVWAKIGQAPLARSLEHLATAAQGTQQAITGDTPAEMAEKYKQVGWQVDSAVLHSLAEVSSADDIKAVQTAVRSCYSSWLDDSAYLLQKAVSASGYPATIIPDDFDNGDLVLFVDGLRYDVSQLLIQRLAARGCEISHDSTWSALPTVTSTAKPAVSPVATSIVGAPDCTEFVPMVAASGKILTTHYFRKMFDDAGWQVLESDESGAAEGKAWGECGDLDHYGHEHGWKLARHQEVQLRELSDRVESLLNAGWTRIRIVTDHGWLLLPGGLPKADIPKCLAETRWGRCALLKESASTDHQIVPWHWHKDMQVVIAPGISCFTSGREYDHGGVSLQECLIPLIAVTRKKSHVTAKIAEHAWRGLRCKVTIEGDVKGVVVDIRTKPADVTSSVAGGGKAIGDDCSASLMVEDDALLGVAAVLVVVDQYGSVIAKVPTSIGGEK